MHIVVSVPVLTLALALALLPLSTAILSLESMRDLTRVTEFVRGRVEGCIGGRSSESQVVFGEVGEGFGDFDGGEVEIVISASLKQLCSQLLIELERPSASSSLIPLSASQILDDESKGNEENGRCKVIKQGYHNFLEATAKFIRIVHESETRWRWSHESSVFEGVGWLQGLWASRKTNTQDRSFIEQQMELYAQTDCFEKGGNEVLRSGVEVVEFLNDVLDLFP